MLRFASKPDHVFRSLLAEAIGLMIDDLQLQGDPLEQQEALECLLPHSATLCDLETLKTQLVALRTAVTVPELVQPTDYHWLLLYEVLLENYGIERLDFGALVDLFFWDTDFLDSHIPLMPLANRQCMDVSPETFGLTAGMKPHPEELVLKVCDAELVNVLETEESIALLPRRHYAHGS